MSRGPGIVQRRIAALLLGHPGKLWTNEELASCVYNSDAVTPAQREAVRRSLAKMDVTLPVTRCRTGLRNSGGWHYTVRV